jgi:hypothetical protein
MSTWALVVLLIALNGLLAAFGWLVRRTKARTDARIAERERAWDKRERTWGRARKSEGAGPGDGDRRSSGSAPN